MKKKFLYSILFLVNFFGQLLSQNEAGQWCFGNLNRLNFLASPPSVGASSLISIQGCSSIADASGNLLFYSNGQTVWNQNHQVMANGINLAGFQNNTQSSIIVKQPGSQNLYFVFTVAAFSVGLNYSVVDMSMAAGMGSVTTKNTPLYQQAMPHMITAVKHCNGSDVWVIIHDGQNFQSYLVTSSGVSVTPVITNLGISSAGGGTLKASANGQRLGKATSAGSFDVYDFDASSGIVSNQINLFYSISVENHHCEFSPDGTKFYGIKMTYVPISARLFQWDLCAGSATAIAASIYTVSAVASLRQMQVAKDGKIYLARTGTPYLGVINDPNVAGAGCNFAAAGVTLTSNSTWGLPNFMSSYFLYHPLPGAFTHTVNPITSCQTASFTAPPAPITATGCAVSYSFVSMAWNFGDPASGAANTSFINNPIHTFSSPGTYTTSLVFYYSCGGTNDTIKEVLIIQPPPALNINTSSITCANLGSATVSPTGGGGPFTFSWMPGGQTTSVITSVIPGSYSVTVTSNNGYCVVNTSANFLPLVPLSGTLAATSLLNCNAINDGTASINNLSGGSATQLYNWSNGLSTFTTPTTNSLGIGQWTVTVTDALTACLLTNTFAITQPPALSLSIVASSPSACAGSSINFTANVSGGTPLPAYTYSWANSSTGSVSSISPGSAGNYTNTMIAYDGNNCSIADNITFSIVPNPTLSVSSISICPLQTGTLLVSGASTYTWDTNTLGSSLSDSPLVTTLYSVTGESLACTSVAAASIVIMPVPVPTLTSNSPLCEAGTLNLSAGGGTAYAWSGPAAFTSVLQNPVINPIVLNQAGVYELTVTAANTCTAPAAATIVVYATPSLVVSAPAVCSSQTLNLLASSVVGATYLWNGPQNFTYTLQNVSIVSPNINQSGLYSLTVTSTQGCTNTAVLTTTVVPPPNLGVALSSNSLCAQALSGSPNTITLTANGASTYTIATPNHIYNPNPAGPSSPLNMVPPYQPTGPATATVSGSNGVCTVSSSVVFTIIPNPTVSVNNFTPVICAGESYTYTSSGASSYTWSAANPGNTLYTTGNVAVANPSINSVFSVVGGSLGCNSAMQTSTLTVNPLPVVLVNSAQICPNTSAVLTASGTGTSYSWSPALGLSASIGSSVSASPMSTQNYIVTSSLNNCNVDALLTVSVLPLPEPSIIASQQEVCLYDKITFIGDGGQTYQWAGPGNVNLVGKEVIYTASNINQAGMFTLTITDNLGCKNSASMLIGIKQLPNGSVDGTKNGCVPLCTELNFKGNNSTSSWWSFNNQTFSNTISYCFKTVGTYTIGGSLYDAVSTCSNNIAFVVNVYPNPVANFEFSPSHPIEGMDEVLFTNTSSGNNLANFNWYFNNNAGYTSSNQHTSYLFENEGVYPIAMVVSNANGCSDTLIKTITVEPNFNIYVPNAFTPNGDNLNDVFLPVGSGIKTYSLLIFDRWGGKLFESANILVGWDGTFRGEPVKMDSYNWKISATNAKGDKKEMAGHVNLIR